MDKGVLKLGGLYTVNDRAMLPPYGDYTPEQICSVAEVCYLEENVFITELSEEEIKEIEDFIKDNNISFREQVLALIRYKELTKCS